MKVRYIEQEIYSFDELSESAKENAINQYLEGFRETEFFTEDVNDLLSTLFPNSTLNCEYRLSYCQGDGLNIYGTMKLNDLLNYYGKEKGNGQGNIFPQCQFLSPVYNKPCEIEFEPNYRYGYYIEKETAINDSIIELFESCEIERIPYDLIENFAKETNEMLRELCKRLENNGYSYFYDTDGIEDEIKETWESNDYIGFDADGTHIYI